MIDIFLESRTLVQKSIISGTEKQSSFKTTQPKKNHWFINDMGERKFSGGYILLLKSPPGVEDSHIIQPLISLARSCIGSPIKEKKVWLATMLDPALESRSFEGKKVWKRESLKNSRAPFFWESHEYFSATNVFYLEPFSSFFLRRIRWNEKHNFKGAKCYVDEFSFNYLGLQFIHSVVYKVVYTTELRIDAVLDSKKSRWT